MISTQHKQRYFTVFSVLKTQPVFYTLIPTPYYYYIVYPK